jgi:Heavy metal binding domain
MKILKILLMAVLTIMSATVIAQDTSMHHMKMHKMDHMKYSCPMHPKVTSNKPGKCSKCGMDMTKMKEHNMDKMYCCAKHPDVKSDKPGKCPKCGMDMTKMKEHNMDKMYCCAKHPDIKSDKPGKCPKCGAALNLSPKEKMKMGVMKMYTCPMHAEVTSKKPGKCPTCGMDMVKIK